MFKLTAVIYIVLISCSVNKPYQVHAKVRLDSVFLNWNKSTLESLNRQNQLITDSMQKAIYENRIRSVKEYWNIKNINDFNDQSIRYKAIKSVYANLNGYEKNFYIIEANESGSKLLLRIFVLYVDSNNKINVNFYDFFNGEWKKKGKFEKENFNFQVNLKKYISEFGKGFNYDDIVITEFKNGSVRQSEYYLYSTLSSESKIKSILDGYRKENFIK